MRFALLMVEKVYSIPSLQVKVDNLKNKNRSTRRQLAKVIQHLSTENDSSGSSTSSQVPPMTPKQIPNAKVLWNQMTPRTKAKMRQKLSDYPDSSPETINLLRKDGIRLDRASTPSETVSSLGAKIKEFINRDDNSMKCPDKKKEHLRYRLNNLTVFHEQFLSENPEVQCCYSNFCRYIPENVVKPKAQDWGTCLCVTCLNPELKMEALSRLKDKPAGLSTNLQEILKFEEKELKDFSQNIKQIKGLIKYMVWTKKKADGKEFTDTKSYTYHSRKEIRFTSASNFATTFLQEIKELKEHTNRQISQFRRIKEVKNFVQNPENQSACLRIDWSENATLFQTRQEKGAYYHDIQISIHTIVGYFANSETISYGALSDTTSHKAPTVSASMKPLIEKVAGKGVKKLFIVSDSPSSQYRNKFCAYLMKSIAIDLHIKIDWVFTESGHGKGPMDGVGAVIKNAIDQTIAYHPNDTVTSTKDVLRLLEPIDVEMYTFSKDDIKCQADLLPSPKSLRLICKKFGISLVHEWCFDPLSPNSILWKKLSSDKDWVKATFQIGKKFEKPAQTSSKQVDEINLEETDANFEEENIENQETDGDFEDDNNENQETDKNPTFKLIPFSETTENSWVVVNYEEEYFLGKIIEKYDAEKKCKIRCLEKPFGIIELQDMEKEHHCALYHEWQIYHAPAIPKLVKANRGWKYTYSL